MKNLSLTLLAFTLLSPLMAESDAEWMDRRRREIMKQLVKEEGMSPKQAFKIARDRLQQEMKERQGQGSDESTAPEGDDLDEIEADWRERLAQEGLSGDDLNDRLDDEMKIQKKLVKLDADEREAESAELHAKEAKKFVSRVKGLKDYPDSYSTHMIESWEDWFWLSDTGRENWILDERDKREEQEIADRKRRGRKVHEECHKELKAYWAERGLHQKHKAAINFSSSWDTLIDVPSRLYKKEKAGVKETLKRNGFDSKATGIFFKHMDSLFTEPD